MGDIVFLHQFDLYVLVAFLVEVAVYDVAGVIEHIRCELRTLHDAYLGCQFVAFGFLHSVDVHFRHLGPYCQHDVEEYAVAAYFAGFDSHVGEESVVPILLHYVGDIVAWHTHIVAYREA